MRKKGKFEASSRPQNPQPAEAAASTQAPVKKGLPGILLLLFYWAALAYLEVLLHLFTSPDSGWTGVLFAAIFAVEPAILLYAIGRCFWAWLGRVFAVLSTLVMVIFFGSQLVYYEVFMDFYTAYSMANGAQVADMGSIIGPAIWSRLWQILMMIVPLMALIFGMVKGAFPCRRAQRGYRALLPVVLLLALQTARLKLNIPWEKAYIVIGVIFVLLLAASFLVCREKNGPKGVSKWKSGLALAMAALVIQAAGMFVLPYFGTEQGTAYDYYYVSKCEMQKAVPVLGLHTSFRLDVQQLFFGSGAVNNAGSLVIPDTPETTQVNLAATTTAPSVGTAGTEPSAVTEPAPTEPEYNILDIDWDTLISGETDGVLKETHQYFASQTASQKNEKTGLFEGCNLIMLTCEAFYYAAIDPELTPTLYKMQTEGFQFTNFYTSGWYASTTDGEYVALTGTIPISGKWALKATQDNYMPLVMGNQLKSLGYDCRAYHNHTYTYYSRDKSHPNLGYIWKAVGNGLDVRQTWPESDLEMMELTCDEYMGSEPFHTYYMTVSGHAGYSWGGNFISSKNRELVEDLPYSDTVKAYLATQIELDRALEYLLNKLEEYGIAENTVIVMTADHYPYGMVENDNYQYINELVGHEVDTTFELYRNACIIYKKGMTPEIIDEPCSSMDLLPTLSNLFGLEFDSRLYMGRDVFSDAEPLVFFNHRGWITDKAIYNPNTGKVTSLTGEEISDEYVQSIKDAVNNKFIVSQRIVDYDYWRVLFNPD